jgi:putative SOS response-associated peptidase YedK
VCGRFTLHLAELAELRLPLGVERIELRNWRPRYNIAPGQQSPVALVDGEARALRGLRWGLVPEWARDESVGQRLINARVETLADKPSFRDAFAHRRCLVPATGYFEWKPGAGGRGKQPHWVHRRDGEPLTMAGLWSRFTDPAGEAVDTFAVVTTDAGGAIRELHDRMPLCLDGGDRDGWLARGSLAPQALTGMVARAADTGGLELWPVDPAVGSPSHDDPSCIAPATGPEGNGQLGLFE